MGQQESPLPWRFAFDRRGGVVITFALGLVPLMLALGLGLDYARAQQARRALDVVADSAVLAALAGDPDEAPISAASARSRGLAYFDAQTGTNIDAVVRSRSIKVSNAGG